MQEPSPAKKLRKAVRNCDLSLLEEALSAGADVNGVVIEGMSLLCYAAWLIASLENEPAASGWRVAAQRLCEAGADPNSVDESGGTALFYASVGMDVDTARLLIESGADVNGRACDSMTPLVRAVQSGDAEMVKLLVGNGVDVGQSVEGKTARDYANFFGRGEIEQYLSSLRRARWNPATHASYPREDRRRVRAVMILRSRTECVLKVLPRELVFVILATSTEDTVRYVR